MTTKRFPIYRDIINLILVFTIVMSLDMVLSSSMKIYIPIGEYIGIGMIIIYTYLLRENITKMYIYAILHAIMMAICVLPKMDPMLKLKVVIVAIVFCIIDVYNWYNLQAESSDIHWGLGSFLLVSFVFCSGRYEFGYSKTVYYMGVLFVALIMIRELINNFYELSRSGQLTDEMPVRELFRNNSLIAGLIVLLVIGLMIFVRADELILSINRFMLFVLEKIGELISKVLGNEVVMPDENTEIQNLLKMIAIPAETDGFLVILLRILDAIITIIITVLFVYIVIKGTILLIGLLRGTRDKKLRHYRVYKVKNEVRERLTSEKIKKKRSLFMSVKERARYIYKKELLKYKKDGVNINKCRTPSQHRKEILKTKGNDILQANQIYEKIRYKVDYEATQEDVSKIKNSFKAAKR